jgi:uncharacterized membrane protein
VADSGGKDRPAENIFKIMDEIVYQLNKTKTMFLLMIISIVVVVPGTFIATFALAGDIFWTGPPHGRLPDAFAFATARAIVFAFILVWIVIGVRQWFVLSKWTKRYEQYKELQKKVEEKLDYDKNNEKPGDKNGEPKPG